MYLFLYVCFSCQTSVVINIDNKALRWHTCSEPCFRVVHTIGGGGFIRLGRVVLEDRTVMYVMLFCR